MPSLNSNRFTGRPTSFGHQTSPRKVCAGQPTKQELCRMQLQRAADHLGLELPSHDHVPATGQRTICDDAGRNRDFEVEVRTKKVLHKPY